MKQLTMLILFLMLYEDKLVQINYILTKKKSLINKNGGQGDLVIAKA